MVVTLPQLMDRANPSLIEYRERSGVQLARRGVFVDDTTFNRRGQSGIGDRGKHWLSQAHSITCKAEVD
jgi:hypothetical protein